VGHRRQAHLIDMDLPAIFIFSGLAIAPGITTYRRTLEGGGQDRLEGMHNDYVHPLSICLRE